MFGQKVARVIKNYFNTVLITLILAFLTAAAAIVTAPQALTAVDKPVTVGNVLTRGVVPVITMLVALFVGSIVVRIPLIRKLGTYLARFRKNSQFRKTLIYALFGVIVAILAISLLFSIFSGFYLIAGAIFIVIFSFFFLLDLIIGDRSTNEELIKDEEFLNRFITRVKDDKRVEHQLWDFKQTLDMWHTRGKEKTEKEIKFCELLAGWANTTGGLQIVGITNSPREIVGVDDLENKLHSSGKVVQRYIEPRSDFICFQQILMPSQNGEPKPCLIIAVAQTKEVISVRDERGRYSYPKRIATGLDRVSHNKIYEEKRAIISDNYDFMRELENIEQALRQESVQGHKAEEGEKQ